MGIKIGNFLLDNQSVLKLGKIYYNLGTKNSAVPFPLLNLDWNKSFIKLAVKLCKNSNSPRLGFDLCTLFLHDSSWFIRLTVFCAYSTEIMITDIHCKYFRIFKHFTCVLLVMISVRKATYTPVWHLDLNILFFCKV